MEPSETLPRRRARPHARPARCRPVLRAALAVAAMGAVTAGGTVCVRARAHSDAGAVSSAASPAASSSAPAREEGTVVPVSEPPAVDRKAVLRQAVRSVRVPSGAQVSAAVLDLDSGAGAVSGDTAFDTASIVKVDILAALLLQAQDAGRRLTAAERSYAAKMIENSDNASATALWHTIGRSAGLDAANARFGLRGPPAVRASCGG